MSPFLALYGYHPPSITSPLKKTTKIQEMENHIGNQQEVLKLLKENLVMTQNRMKQQAYQHHSEREFEVGDWVFLGHWIITRWVETSSSIHVVTSLGKD
jgi:hypothetical protein